MNGRTLNLSNGKYEPYNMPNNKPLYMNSNSNDPPNVNKFSSDETVSNSSKELLKNALSNSGFDHKIKFQPHT